MKNKQMNVKCLMLVGNSAVTIPSLAVVGAVSIMGAIAYGSYKLSYKLCDMIANKIEEELEKEC